MEAIAAKVKDVETAKAAVTATVTSMEETKKAIEEANKKLQALAAEMETKQKAVAEAEKNKMAADAELAKHDQALATATEGVDRANALIPKQEQLVATETMALTAAQQAFDMLKTVAAPVARMLAFDATGHQVVVASSDNVWNVFEAQSGKPVAKLQSTPGSRGGMDYRRSKSGRRVGRQLLHVGFELAVATGKSHRWPTLNLFSDRITALDFSPDGQQLAVGSGPPSRFGDVKLLAVASGEVQRDMGEIHSDTILGVRYSPDGRYLATAAADKLCKLFALDTMTALRSFEGHTHHV